MRPVAILLPAFYPDAIGQSEWHDDLVGCPRCGVVQRVARFYLRWACVSPGCPLVTWLKRQANYQRRDTTCPPR